MAPQEGFLELRGPVTYGVNCHCHASRARWWVAVKSTRSSMEWRCIEVAERLTEEGAESGGLDTRHHLRLATTYSNLPETAHGTEVY